MNNLKLRNKIFLILVLPLFAIFMLSSILIFEKVEKVLNMDKTSSYIEFTDQMSKLLANLQKERELSLSYINSYAQTKKDDLENQIKVSKGYLGTFGKNATKNFKLTLKSDTLLYEPLELIFPYKDTLSTPKTISSSIS